MSEWRILRLTCREAWLDLRQTCPALRCFQFGSLDNGLDHICRCTTIRRSRRLSVVLDRRLGLPSWRRRGLLVVAAAVASVPVVVSPVKFVFIRRPDAPIVIAIAVPISAAIALTAPAVPVVVARVIVAPIPSPASLNLTVIMATAIEVTVSLIATVAMAAFGIAAAAVHELGGGGRTHPPRCEDGKCAA